MARDLRRGGDRGVQQRVRGVPGGPPEQAAALPVQAGQGGGLLGLQQRDGHPHGRGRGVHPAASPRGLCGVRLRLGGPLCEDGHEPRAARPPLRTPRIQGRALLLGAQIPRRPGLPRGAGGEEGAAAVPGRPPHLAGRRHGVLRHGRPPQVPVQPGGARGGRHPAAAGGREDGPRDECEAVRGGRLDRGGGAAAVGGPPRPTGRHPQPRRAGPPQPRRQQTAGPPPAHLLLPRSPRTQVPALPLRGRAAQRSVRGAVQRCAVSARPLHP
mmetsp:Transcript_5629/g.7816  ORF Transcript_5629/g.7816 Transcript_5629/m.7816 type:complete len:269 (+) Transcript_5629:543-1349(+)